jgi:DNA-binding CsgD family transcriptional regulator
MADPLTGCGLIGREAETGIIDRLLADAGSGRSGVLVLTGEAGVGKSALLAHAQARAGDMRVLQTAGVQSEAEINFAALSQLLRPALDGISSLPPPQSEALAAALGMMPGRPANRFLIGAAVLSLLSETAGGCPLLCLVDDAGWLDYESAVAIAFAARRLEAEAVVMIVAARSKAGTPFAGFPARTVDGLSRGQAEALLAAHHPRVDPLIRERVIERACGNPLALLEFASRLQEIEPPVPPFLVGLAPTAVESLYLEQVRALPDETQLLLLVAAAEDSQALGLIMRAGSRLGIKPEALEPAEQAGIVVVSGDQIMFGHPLARSATYAGATFGQRQRVHRALADACGPEEPDRRAWHHAAAALAPDEEVARELESTARRAQLRSGQAAASAALERAAQLSGEADDKAARLVAAAQAAWRAGNGDRAIALIELATPLPGDARLRADAAEVRGLVRAQSGMPRQAAAALAAAAEKIISADPRRSVRLAVIAAEASWFAGQQEHLGQLDALVSSLPASQGVLGGFMRAYVAAIAATLQHGLPAAASQLRAAARFTAGVNGQRALSWAGDCAMLLEDSPAAQDLYSRAVDRSRELANIADLMHALHLRARCELELGKLAVAEADAAEALQFGRQLNQPGVIVHSLAVLARVAALRGDVGESRRRAAEALEHAIPHGLQLAVCAAVLAHAEIDVGLGHCGAALERLEPLIAEPLAYPGYLIELAAMTVEAAAQARTPARAQPALALCEAWAACLDAAGPRAILARCRGLLADAREAERHFDEALRLHAEQPNPLDQARTRLNLGEHLRRTGRRAAARPHLRSAMEVFDSLGARLLADRAAGELRASGEVARRRPPGAVSDLTPRERQVARLATAGASNGEVAARLFLSQKTVEYHLHKVFTKLGVTSRTDLAALVDRAALADGAGQDSAGPDSVAPLAD